MGLKKLFQGMSDKYARRANKSGAQEAYYARTTRYENNWRAYRRRRYENNSRRKENQVTDLGTIGSYIDRVVSFCHSKPWGLTLDPAESVTEAQTDKLKEMLAYVKQAESDNAIGAISIEVGYSCAVTGDGIILPQPEIEESLLTDYVGDIEEAERNNRDAIIKYIVIQPNHVYDIVLAPDGRTITYICFRIPVTKVVNGERHDHYFQQEITAEKILEVTTDGDGKELTGKRERNNPIGAVYAVHIKNFPIGSKWGIDDVDGLIGISDQINEKVSNISAIIDYHEAPTTVIFGAKARTLEKGENKLWSGLPSTAKIQVLKNEADLEASVKFLETLKASMQQQSGVNDAALGSEDLVSNVSGSAMELRFYPLLSKAALKWASWDEGVRKLCINVLKWGRYLKHVSFTNEDLRRFTNSLEVRFSSNLPTNEKEEIQNSVNRLKAGITSFVAEISRHGDQSPEKTLGQLEKDLKEYPALMGLLGLQNLVSAQANAQSDDRRVGNTNPQGAPVDPPEDDIA